MYVYMCKYGISVVVIWYGIDAIDYGRRTPELSNAPLHMKQDTSSTDKRPLKIDS